MHIKSCFPKDIPLGAVVSIISRSRLVFLNNRLRPFDLSSGQFPILMLLSCEQNIIQEDLVRHYRLDKGTIARAVRKLEDGGYIRRITDPGNRRAVRLFLTEKGEQVIPRLHDINREWETQISTGFSKGDLAMLKDLMRRAALNSFAILQKDGDRDNEHE